MKPKKPKKSGPPPEQPSGPEPSQGSGKPVEIGFVFDLFLVFYTIRKHYAVLLSDDRAFYAPFAVQPVQKKILESLIYKKPIPEVDPYILMLDTWKSLSVEVKSLKLQTHKIADKLPEIVGRLQLKQPSGLGVNIADVQTSASDLFIISMLLELPIYMGKEEISLVCAQPKDPQCPDDVLSHEIQIQMGILENAAELKGLLNS